MKFPSAATLFFIQFVLPLQLSNAFLPISTPTTTPSSSFTRHAATQEETVVEEISTAATSTSNPTSATLVSTDKVYWEIGATLYNKPSPLVTPELQLALETNTYPTSDDDTNNLGRGVFVTRDWRRAYHTYESPVDDPDLIDPLTGEAEYTIDGHDIDGVVPGDLVGVLYRNGPGKLGVDGERVQHVLDADGLVVQITFPPMKEGTDGKEDRTFKFRS